MGPGIKRLKRETVHSLYSPVTLGKYLLPNSATLSSSGLEVLVPEGRTHLQGATRNIPLTQKLIVPPERFRFLMPLNQQAKKRLTVFGEATDPDYQKKVGLFLHDEDNKDNVLERRRSFRMSLDDIMSCD